MAGIPRTVGVLGIQPKFDERVRANTPEHWLVLDRDGTELSFVIIYLSENKDQVIVYSSPMVRPVRVCMGSMPHDWTMECTLDNVARMNNTTIHAIGASDATHVTFMWLVMYGRDVLDGARAQCDSDSDVKVIDIQPWHEALDSKDGMTDNKKKELLVSYARATLSKTMRVVRSDLEMMIKMNEQHHTPHGDSVVEEKKMKLETLIREEAELQGKLDELEAQQTE